MKILKLVKPYPVILYSGRADILSINLDPENSIINYASIVNENINSTTYNHDVIQNYIDTNILTVIQTPDPMTWPDKLMSIAPASASGFISWSDTWTILNAETISSAVITQGKATVISGFVTDTFTTVVTGIAGNTLLTSTTTSQTFNSGIIKYDCSVLINGTTTLNAVLTIEYAPLGS
jgi:hypothetical protein